ncbi:fibrinogen alpha chain [Thalassophryne amazonica]|uniref:fibrinogen alpha chain n=1 Tax=Thalassophryne amazonica TaxID=390379 RepID=UPI0014711767|nr:fibrinogen alpha chain [Thalassophryne amazonica]
MFQLCEMVKTNKDASEASMTLTAHIYNSNRQAIVKQYVAEMKFLEYSSALTRKVTSLRQRSTDLLHQFKEVVNRAQQQLMDLYRTEVDIEMKLRACHGSCRSVSPISINHVGYQTFQTHMDHLDKSLNETTKGTATPKNIPYVKVRHVGVNPSPSGEYKTILTVQREFLTQFEDIRQNQFVLEETP